jgi:hypothetical protein
MTLSEGRSVKSALTTLIDYWGEVAFKNGKLDGLGYGNKFSTFGP